MRKFVVVCISLLVLNLAINLFVPMQVQVVYSQQTASAFASHCVQNEIQDSQLFRVMDFWIRGMNDNSFYEIYLQEKITQAGEDHFIFTRLIYDGQDFFYGNGLAVEMIPPEELQTLPWFASDCVRQLIEAAKPGATTGITTSPFSMPDQSATVSTDPQSLTAPVLEALTPAIGDLSDLFPFQINGNLADRIQVKSPYNPQFEGQEKIVSFSLTGDELVDQDGFSFEKPDMLREKYFNWLEQFYVQHLPSYLELASSPISKRITNSPDPFSFQGSIGHMVFRNKENRFIVALMFSWGRDSLEIEIMSIPPAILESCSAGANAAGAGMIYYEYNEYESSFYGWDKNGDDAVKILSADGQYELYILHPDPDLVVMPHNDDPEQVLDIQETMRQRYIILEYHKIGEDDQWELVRHEIRWGDPGNNQGFPPAWASEID